LFCAATRLADAATVTATAVEKRIFVVDYRTWEVEREVEEETASAVD